MSKVNNLPKSMPDTSYEFTISLQGSVTKKLYAGEFTCKIQNLKDQAMIAKHEAALNGDAPMFLPPGILKLNKMIAYLRYTLTEVPKFWRDNDLGYELKDFNIVEAVYDEVLAFEERWIKLVWAPEEEVQEDSKDDGKDKV